MEGVGVARVDPAAERVDNRPWPWGRRIRTSSEAGREALPGSERNVYVILLDDGVRLRARFARENPHASPDLPCLYVGVTGLTPEERFANHKRGHRASRYVREFGIRLLPEHYEHLNPMPDEAALEMEVDLAIELRKMGYAVWQR
jgi:hypothetical protein